MQGICLYPVMDYPGWNDERHCPCGVIACDAQYEERRLVDDLVRQVAEERFLFERDGLIVPARRLVAS